MELVGEQVIPAPREAVWSALNDPSVLSRCIPGCEAVERISDNETHARVAVKIGPVRARFSGKILLTDVDAPAGCTFSFEGSGGAAGFAKGRSVVTLAEAGEGTRLSYSVEASVGGKLGQVGGRLVDSSAKKMADEFFGAFRATMSAPPAAEAAPGEAVTGEAVTGVEAPPAAAPAAAAAPATAAATPQSTLDALRPEIHRAFWFLFGALAGFLACRFLP